MTDPLYEAPGNVGLMLIPRRIGCAVIAGLLLSACSTVGQGALSSTTSTPVTPDSAILSGPTSTSSTTTTQPPAPITFTGQGEINTVPQHLNAGDYQVSAQMGGPCAYFVDLVNTTNGNTVQPNGDSLVSGNGPTSESTVAYNVTAGDYYAEATTGPVPSCPWTVTLTPGN